MLEDGKESFLSIDDVLGTGESFPCEQRALGAHAPRPRINRILHVGQLACRDRSRTKRARCADAHGRDHLRRREIQDAPRRDWRRERAQGGVMPPIFAHAGPAHFAKTHFNLVGNDRCENQILAAETFALAQRQRRRDEIAGMTWIGLPIDVVVIHGANHVAI